MKNNFTALRIALVAMLTAIVVVFTLLVRIPTPIKGYISLCDVAIVFSAYLFGPLVGAIAGALGSGIADLLGGYAQWAPISFIIHGLQGLLIGLIAYNKKFANEVRGLLLVRIILASLVGIVVMSGGYYLAGGFLYGFKAALAELPLNILQAAFGSVVGIAASHGVLKAYPPVRSLGF